ncbi:hypothetical protein CDD83_2207 [Cordyceps sp. RAO-2017]|nr:hypothetical protein CDD83_2207 [Cordyceps sp. RAO-2017]
MLRDGEERVGRQVEVGDRVVLQLHLLVVRVHGDVVALALGDLLRRVLGVQHLVHLLFLLLGLLPSLVLGGRHGRWIGIGAALALLPVSLSRSFLDSSWPTAAFSSSVLVPRLRLPGEKFEKRFVRSLKRTRKETEKLNEAGNRATRYVWLSKRA